MQLHIRLYGSLRDLLPVEQNGRITLEIPENTTIPDLKGQLGIDRAVTTAVNGAHVEDDHPLAANDQISFFAIMGGG